VVACGEGVVMGVWWAALGLHAVVSRVVRRARVIARRGGVILRWALMLRRPTVCTNCMTVRVALSASHRQVAASGAIDRDPFGVDALAQIGIDQRGVGQQIDRAIEQPFQPQLQVEEGVGVAARWLVFGQVHDKIQIAGVRGEVRPGGRSEEFQPPRTVLAAQRCDVVVAVEDEAGDSHGAIEGRSGMGVKRGLVLVDRAAHRYG